MEYYSTLLKMGVFCREDVAGITGNIRTADSLLYAYKKKGWVASVRRNLYVAISLETGQPACSPYQIAAHVSPDAYVSHHSAFEVHGMANQIFSHLYVSSASAFRPFEFDGRRFARVPSITAEGVRNVGGIRVTDLERTVVDSVRSFAQIGGLEELLRCLTMITYADADKLTRYLTIYDNCFLWQKTGYILSYFPNMKLPDTFFDACRANARKNVRYLYNELRFEAPVFDTKWNLYVPKDILKLLDKGGQPLV